MKEDVQHVGCFEFGVVPFSSCFGRCKKISQSIIVVKHYCNPIDLDLWFCHNHMIHQFFCNIGKYVAL
jgi:hypothetical protein